VGAENSPGAPDLGFSVWLTPQQCGKSKPTAWETGNGMDRFALVEDVLSSSHPL
jgi:hypothetical protein